MITTLFRYLRALNSDSSFCNLISSTYKVTSKSVPGIHYCYSTLSLQAATLALLSHLQFNHRFQKHLDFILMLLLIIC